MREKSKEQVGRTAELRQQRGRRKDKTHEGIWKVLEQDNRLK